ncbi:MAG: hypothetical protein ACP5T4_03250 [Candidatus Micrarchaeia archaeon]
MGKIKKAGEALEKGDFVVVSVANFYGQIPERDLNGMPAFLQAIAPAYALARIESLNDKEARLKVIGNAFYRNLDSLTLAISEVAKHYRGPFSPIGVIDMQPNINGKEFAISIQDLAGAVSKDPYGDLESEYGIAEICHAEDINDEECANTLEKGSIIIDANGDIGLVKKVTVEKHIYGNKIRAYAEMLTGENAGKIGVFKKGGTADKLISEEEFEDLTGGKLVVK